MEGARLVRDLMAAASVGSGIFIMVVTDAEHPPAAGTTLGLVVHGWSWSAVAFIMSCAVAPSLLRLLLGRRMVNLL